MGAVGYTSNGFKFIRISSCTYKNIQEGSAEIICEDIDILSHPITTHCSDTEQTIIHYLLEQNLYLLICENLLKLIEIFKTYLISELLKLTKLTKIYWN